MNFMKTVTRDNLILIVKFNISVKAYKEEHFVKAVGMKDIREILKCE